MIIYLGADHRGFELKEKLKAHLSGKGYEVQDLGAPALDPADDYPDFAAAVGRAVSRNPEARGIVICGSGAGVDTTANKFRHVRSAFGMNTDQVFDMRHDDDINVMAIASNFISADDAAKMADVFVQTPFSGEDRHRRRLDKIAQIENGWK